MGLAYRVDGSGTTNAAAVKDFLSVKAAANQRIKIRSIHIGHDSAVSAQGVRFQLLVFASGQTDVTGSAFTPVAMDQGNTRTAKATAKDTVTVNASGTNKKVGEFAFDILSPVNKTYAPGEEITVEDGEFLVVRKQVGADATGNWAVGVVVEE
jgi:hypothetical protein